MGRWLHLKKSTVLCWVVMVGVANGIGVNWGTQTSHLLPPSTVVQMLKNDGFQQVKLFDAEEGSMNALRRSGIEVMVGIPNDMLEMLATSTRAAQKWVSQNVSDYLNDEVNIRYVAVGNEPFLTTFNGSYIGITLPAIQNIQRALADADLSNRVKVTVPLNADVYQSASDRPSDGDFRPDIHDLMLNITRFLNDNGAPFIVNIYPFISLYNNPNFPVDFAFFDGTSSPVVDGTITYTNMFDANYDTLIWALRKSGFGNLPVIVGEIGWPTDGDINANLQLAQKFNQGFMARIASRKGTPLRPGPINAYIFSLIDEDQKSVMPGNFERHWGIYTFDGLPKYQLDLGKTNNSLVRAKNVRYLEKKWCVFNPSASLDDANVAPSVSYACANADCTSLGFRTSCSNLDARGNISYAFNSYYQMNDQINEACGFDNLAVITNMDPSTSTCRFQIMIQTDSGSFPRFRSFFFLWCFIFAHLLYRHAWF